MTWWESILLGLIQGLTEFLPVSSSGHLVLGQHLLGLNSGNGDVLFEVMVHFGTVLSVVFIYRTRIAGLIESFARTSVQPRNWGITYRDDEQFRMGVQILITMIPTALVYVVWGSAIEAAFSSPRLAAGMLLFTGVLLTLTLLRRDPKGSITARKSLLIGLAQAVAMIPGISRSGATICAALYQDVEPEKAADFSFLMLLPIVVGATLLKVSLAMGEAAVANWPVLIAGTIAAFISGILAIRVALDFVRRGRLHLFAIYCFTVGAVALWLL